MIENGRKIYMKNRIEEVKRDYEIDLNNLPGELVQVINKLLEKIADLEEDVENLKCRLGYSSGLSGNSQQSHYAPTLSDEVSSLRNDLGRLEETVRWGM